MSKVKTFPRLLITFISLLFLLASCTNGVESDLNTTSEEEQLYNSVKSEMLLGLNSHSLRSYIESKLTIEELSQIETDPSYKMLDYISKIEKLNVTDSTKSFLYNLPVYISNKTVAITLGDIDGYSIPQEEKVLMIKAIAMIDAIKESYIYYPYSTRTRNGDDAYWSSIEDCLDDFYTDLGFAVGDAVIAGGIGAFGGPVTAGVSCAVTGIWGVGKAYSSWRKCKF